MLNLQNKHDIILGYMNRFMNEALNEAKKAFDKGEVPIGAVIVKDDKIIAAAHNRTIELGDPTAHAEMLAIRQAAAATGGWRLPGCSMYVTIEPCSMCAGAMVWARLESVYIGSMDPKAGACGSVMNIPECDALNHQVEIHTGIMEEECSAIMKAFFYKIRQDKRRKDGND